MKAVLLSDSTRFAGPWIKTVEFCCPDMSHTLNLYIDLAPTPPGSEACMRMTPSPERIADANEAGEEVRWYQARFCPYCGTRLEVVAG